MGARKFWLACFFSFVLPCLAWAAPGDPYDYYDPGSTFLVIFPRDPGEPILPSLKDSDVDEEKPKTWEQFLLETEPLKPDRRLYQQMRKDIESKRASPETLRRDERDIEERLAVPVEIVLPAGEAPRPKPPELEIPAWEGKVDIVGRKLIALNLATKKFLNPPNPLRPRATPKNVFELRQELQLRVQGNVSDRVIVNIDYDDTKENKRDISIVYRGASGEAVKEISFGDITLSLPQTQFTSYSKQLFGIKGEFDFKRARLTVVGSQTKGQFAIKRFSGQYQFESKDILDTAFTRRAFYNIAFDAGHLPLQPGTVIVYRDDKIATNDANSVSRTVEDYAVPTSSYTGNFDVLVAGVDYIVDHQKGILRFTQFQAPNSVIAIDYTAANGARLSSITGAGNPKIMKTDADQQIASAAEVGYRRELKTIYNIGQKKLVRDDGTGNFIFRVLEKGSRSDVSSSLGISYPSQVQVDFEEGTFQLTQQIPDPDPTTANHEIYDNPQSSRYIFYLEYRFTLKTYFLQPNIVLQSEKVYRDGALLARDLDYFIDYDSGFLTFMRPDLITSGTQIEVTYEVAPFGGALTETLVGGRAEVDLLKDIQWGSFGFSKLSLGSSALLQQAAKPATVPDVRSLPSSFSIFEGDAHLLGMKIPGPIPLTTNLHGEIAQSLRNPNTFRKAIVESMEGIKLEDGAILSANFWNIAANPTSERVKFSAISVADDSVRIKDINPGADVGADDTQSAIRINYDLSESSEASVAYLFSPIGLDFSSREFLELALQGDTTAGAPEISFQIGKVNEDADGDGTLDTEDLNSDGGLNFGEDQGYIFNNPTGADPVSVRIGAINGKIDSEDLDRNGRLDAFDDPNVGGRFGLISGSSSTAVNFTNWISSNVPLNIGTNTSPWASIKAVRITLKRTPGGKTSGFIRIARLAVTGSRWERPLFSNSTGTFRVGPINNSDNPNYQSLFAAGGEVAAIFDDLYGGQTSPLGTKSTGKRREQALRIEMGGFVPNAAVNGVGSTRLSFIRPVNVQSHKVLNFFFHGPSVSLPAGTTFFFRFGSASDYFEYRLNLEQPSLANAWHLLKINLEDNNRDGVVDAVSPGSRLDLGPTVSRQGNPNLANVTEFVMGVTVPAGSPAITDEIWVNDIFLTEPREKKGSAHYLAADFDIPRWMNFGGAYKAYDRNFEGLGQAALNQDYWHRSGFLNFNRLAFMPFGGRASKDIIVTPSAIQTGPSNLVSLLSEGRVEKLSVSGSGSFIFPRVPTLNWSSSRDKSDNKGSGRTDDIYNYAGNFAVSSPFGLKFISNWSNSYSRRNFFLKFTKPLRLTGSDNLKEFTDSGSTNMSMNFIGGRLSLNPGYSLSTTKETRKTLSPDDTLTVKTYPKSLSQGANLGLSFRLVPWIAPNFNFSSNINENNRVESSSFTLPGVSGVFQRGDLKNVSRQSNFTVGQTFDFAHILPRFKPFNSFTHSANYSMSDGDSYENVARDFRTNDKLWVREKLDVKNPGSRRLNLTLRDTLGLSSRWSPFLAMFPNSPWSTLSITNNYSKSLERAETTGTQRKSLSITLPDLVTSLGQIERLLHTSSWMSGMQLNSRLSKRRSVTFGVSKTKDFNTGGDLHFLLKQYYDIALNYNQARSASYNLTTNITTSRGISHTGSAQVGFNWRSWRFTSKMGVARNKAIDAIGRLTTDNQTLSPSINARADFNLPAGLGLPFSSKRLTFTNRVILTTGLALQRHTSTLNVEQTNTDEWNWNLNGDFEIGKNLRAGLGSGLNLFKNRVLADQDFYTFNINAQIIFQF